MFEAPRSIRPAGVNAGGVAVGLGPGLDLDARNIIAALWRDKSIILLATAASLLAAFLVVLLVPHRYTAVTQILIDPIDFRAVGNDVTPVNLGNDANVLQIESQVRVLVSDGVLRRVVEMEKLDSDPDFIAPASSGEGTDNFSRAVAPLGRSTGVKRAERTYVVDIGATAADPRKAARIANGIAKAYLAEQTEIRAVAARQISEALSARLGDFRDLVGRR